MKKKPHRISIGIALGGGGARGLAHIGILRGLEKHNFYPNIISGTSAGAIIGSMYAATMDSFWVENRIKNFIKSNQFNSIGLNRLNKKSQKDESLFQSLSSYVKKTLQINIANERLGLLKSERLEDALRYLIPVRKFSDLKIPFMCSAVDLNSGEDVLFNEGKLLNAVLASSAIPGFIQPIQYKGRLLTDGSVSRPIPGQMLKDNKVDFTIGVNVDIKTFNPINNINLIQILGRCEQITTKKLSKFNDRILDIFLEPNTMNLFWGDFTKIDSLIENGVNCLNDNFKTIKKSYIKKLNS